MRGNRFIVSYSKLEPNFYCSNKLDMKADKMLNIYARRWKPFYRDAKQEDYEMRKIVRRHLEMVLTHSLCWVRCRLPQRMAPGSTGSV
jgi:hypothetical protein